MPDERLAKARTSLPDDYQFGDAGWRHPAANFAEQLARRTDAHVHRFTCFDILTLTDCCECGARWDRTMGHVIESDRR